MVKEKDITYRLRTAFMRMAAMLLLAMVVVMTASPGLAYAAKEPEQEEPAEPIREVHNVGVASEAYCFFVTHNVILTPAEVASMTDEELTDAVLERAGLFMKKANCKNAAHKEITVKDWKKNDGIFLLSTTDVEAIRSAAPVDGEPVKFYMDLIVAKDNRAEKEADKEDKEDKKEAEEGSEEGAEEEPEKEDIPLYSTYKRTSPRLLFAVVATEEDAKLGEDICVEDQQPAKKIKMPRISDPGESEEEGLPEYRTINMVDRSGAPIEPTLKEGDPVTLEWIEPADIGKEGKTSFFDRIPGGIAGAAAMAAAAIAAVAAIIYAATRKKTDE